MQVKICPTCEVGHLEPAIRDVKITRQTRSVVVKNVTGFFCTNCNEIEFDDTTDSSARYAAAGDQLVLENRADATFFIQADWDPSAAVWVATSDDVPGLVAEADTLENLETKLQKLVPELLEANGRPVPAKFQIRIQPCHSPQLGAALH